MYYSNGIHPFISQIVSELSFWIDLSLEHPIFIKKIAQSQEIIISKNLKERLNKNFKDFNRLSRGLLVIQQQWNFSSAFFYDHKLLSNIPTILQDTLKIDIDFLQSLKALEELPVKDNSWKIIINHITLEQRQLLQFCSNSLIKIKPMKYRL